VTSRPASIVIAGGLLLATACGGGGTTPNPVPSSPLPTGSNALVGVVFYDQNSNGAVDPDEQVRLPGVRVAVGGQAGASAAGGQVTVSGLPDGPGTLAIQVDTLPPFFQPGRLPTVTLPLAAATVVPVPVTLPIGANGPNQYLAFGDSIAEGTGSNRRTGFATPLQARLRAHWGGDAEVGVDGVRGSRSVDGLARLPAALNRTRPAFVLLLYGTNDWNGRCQSIAPEACFTVGALRDMIRAVRAAGSQPVVGTITPANPSPAADARNRWIQAQNDLIRAMVQQEGAVLAETWAAFGTDQGQWPALFFDEVHPNDDGYTRISEAFFQAITRSRGAR
jgi:lysophospholipase L1-like esterase